MNVDVRKIAYDKIMNEDVYNKEILNRAIKEQYNEDVNKFLDEYAWCTASSKDADEIMVHILARDSNNDNKKMRASILVNVHTLDTKIVNDYRE